MPSDLRLTKKELKELRHRIAQSLPPYSSPEEFLRQYSGLIDSLVRKAFQLAQTKVPHPSVCLIAVGGYGRAELAPYSDIDLLILYPPSKLSELPPLAEQVLYPLWDLGLEVTCSARSVDECLKAAQTDIKIKTSLIDSRYLDGEYEFFRTLYTLFTEKVLHRNVKSFAEGLAREMYFRKQKYQDPIYVLEPDLKEGEGGLRDFQVGRWIFRGKYRTDRLDAILFLDHSRRLEKSVRFLWRIRNHLHLLTERRQDIFTFEWQEKIAPLFGFSKGTKGIEEMLQQYHLAAREISTFSKEILDQVLSEPSPIKKIIFFLRRKKIDPYFGIAHGEIHLLDPLIFKQDPSQLMVLFQHCQTYNAKPDLRTKEAITEALPFIDERFQTSRKVNDTFLSILKQGKGVDNLLMRMHEMGLLSRYIPEFTGVEGKVHYDLYHVHPIDHHTLLALGELMRLKEGTFQREYPLLTSLMKKLERPEILFLSVLLHDIGKGREGHHALTGAEMAKQIGKRMGLPLDDIDLLVFLIRHHLLMCETAFRRDLHDEQAISIFTSKVQKPLQLKMLYLLTFADIKAVGPEAWTSWKNSLLMELFIRTSHLLEKAKEPQVNFKRSERLLRLEQWVPPEILSCYAESLPDRYLATHSPEEVSSHIRMAEHLKDESAVVGWNSGAERRVRVTICTKDRYGLFAKIAGTMFLNRLNILEAQIHTWGNGIALDTFYVEDPTGEIERRLEQFQKELNEILRGETTWQSLLSQKRESAWEQKKVVPKVSGEVRVNNQDSDFYTIVEITGEDRLGILYEITQALTDFGCDIHFARVSTLGNRIMDVFYVQNGWGEKIVEREKTEHLKQLLLNRLTRS